VQDIVVTPRLTIPGSELSIQFARAGGPGGQNVNKVSSKVDLRWNPATSVALGEDDRTWLLQRLRSRLTADGTLIVRAALDRPKPRRTTKPSRASKRRRVADKRHHAEIKRGRRGAYD